MHQLVTQYYSETMETDWRTLLYHHSPSFPSYLLPNKVELVMTVRPIVRIHETSCYMEHGTTFLYEFCMKMECLKDITITALCDID